MSGFPSLQSALTARINPATGFQIGNISAGGQLQVVPIESGFLKSEPGYPAEVDAEFVFGSDYVRMEAAQTHVRIHVNSILKNKDGAFISYSYKGVVQITPEFVAILTNSPDAKTTSYGIAFTHITFETGAEGLKDLEHGIFVGSAHFVVENGGYYIETKISKVIG